MFSSNIVFRARDGHTIIDKASGRIINDTKNNNIHIGKHCWIGYGVTLLKNVTIPETNKELMELFVTLLNAGYNSNEIAKELEVTKEDIAFSLDAIQDPVSLQAPLSVRQTREGSPILPCRCGG